MRAKGTRLAALAAIAGGCAWTVKGSAILAGAGQPAVTFELGLLCFGLSLTLLGWHASARASTWLGAVSTAAGVLAAAADWDPAIAVSAAALVVGLVLLHPEAQPGGRWPQAIGFATVPVTALGGLLGLWDERLLELSTVALGLAWVALGVRLWSVGSRRP